MTRTTFRDHLVALAQTPPAQLRLPEMSDALMRSFLDFGSETKDNLGCAAHVDYGSAEDALSNQHIGLRLKEKAILLSDLMNVVESLPLPDLVQAEFPSLTEEEWSAGLRMITMVMIALEHKMRP
jgi:hypothetical protein